MMERLTIRMDHGIVMNEGYDFGIDPDDYDLVQEILAKLAEYEDSGYDPAEYARQLRAAAKTAEGWFAECKEKEAEAAALKKQHDGVAEAFRLLTEKFEELSLECDALLAEIEGRCDLCTHYNNGNGGKVCEHCVEDQNWEWRGTGGK